ncbi:unnamed protein product [Closterium sp. NIES-64]|nr:unnamed protein product [Closterium sp. NIES-64]
MSDESAKLVLRRNDDLLAKILHLAAQPNQFVQALVCTKWRDMAYRVQDVIHLSDRPCMSHRLLLEQLATFPRLKKLLVGEGRLCFVPDEFLAGLARAHPDLVELRIDNPDGSVGPGKDFSENGLSDFFEGSTNLEDLHLDCPSCMRIPPSIGKLSRLRSLFLTADEIQNLPDAITSLQLLEDFELHARDLQDLPRDFGNLVSLKTLGLVVNSLRSLPTSIQRLVNLQQLSISECMTFRLPDGLSQLNRLNKLQLEDIEDLLALPDNFGKLSALECLVVRRVEGITELPETVGLLPQLQLLTIESEDSSSWLPASLPDVSSLTELDLCQTSVLDLPDGIGRLSKLKSIKLRSLEGNYPEGLSSLPEDFGQLTGLEILHLTNLTHLSHLPDSFTLLSSLQTLEISDCSRVTALPEGMGDGLHHLQKLILSRIPITHLPSSFRLSSLVAIELNGAQCLRGCLLEGFGNFSHLRTLSLNDIPNLTSLPSSLSRLALSLTSLTVDSCRKLRALPEEIGQLEMLEKLQLSKLHSLESIPRSLLKLPRLRELEINCKSLGGSSAVDTLVGGRSNCSSSNVESVEEEVLPSLQSLTIKGVASEVLDSSLAVAGLPSSSRLVARMVGPAPPVPLPGPAMKYEKLVCEWGM